MRATTVVVAPEISEGRDSGTRTLRTTAQVLPPIDCTASTSPRSTSRTDVSTSRAKNGMAPTASGTMAASRPMVVPTIERVKPISATIRMMKGIDRVMFTICPMTLFSDGVLQQPAAVREDEQDAERKSADDGDERGPADHVEGVPEALLQQGLHLRPGHLATFLDELLGERGLGHDGLSAGHVHLEALLAQEADRDDVLLEAAGQLDAHPADLLARDGVHRGAEDRDVDVVRARQLGDDRLGRGLAVERDVDDRAVLAGGLAADREERRGELGAGGREQFVDGAGLDDLSALHQGGRVADRLHDVHLVRDEQDGQAELPVEVAQQLEDRAGGLRVEGAGGLVGEQHLGVAGQGAGDADALLLAAGELGRVVLGLVGEADEVEQFERLAGALCGG